MTDPTDFLEQVAPFSELSAEQRRRLAREFESIEVAAGETIGGFDPPGRNGLFIIVAGSVQLRDLDNRELEQRDRCELFGHAISLEDGVQAYRAIAREDARLMHLSSASLAAMVDRHPVIGRFLTAAPGDRLRSLPNQPSGALRDLNLRSPVTAAPDTSIARCAGLMAKQRVSCLPIVEHGTLTGIVTDRDLRNRVLARGVDPGTPVAIIMTPKPLSASGDSRIEDALVDMMRLGIHHLPVTSENGGLCGVVSAGDLLRLQAPHPLRLVRDIQRAETVDEVADLTRQGPGLLAELALRGGDVIALGRIASTFTDACTRRLLTLALDELGEPPMAWAWLAFGSQARMEQGLISDQDNGLLLAEEPDEAGADYFLKLATIVCDGLDASGYIYCSGDVMATKQWRMSLRRWQRTFEGWMTEPEPQSVMNSSIFFDLRSVAGDHGLAETLQKKVLKQARDSRIFLRFLAAESIGHTPPVGLFRQFLQEDSGEGKGINLKKRGVIPIVDLARVRALEGGIEAVHTEERIRASAAAGGMNERDADDLMHAFRFIGNVRLRHQVRLYQKGQAPNHLVDPDEMSGLHHRYLRSAFGIVRQAQKALAQRYQI